VMVLAHADGSAIDPWNFGRAVGDLIRRSGVTPITPHGLRDMHASLCAKAALPLEVVSQRLGHASDRNHGRALLHVYLDRDADAADAFRRSATRNESGSAVAHLLHGAPKCRENPCKIRTK